MHGLIYTHTYEETISQMLEKEIPSPLLSNIWTTHLACDALYNLAAIWHENPVQQGAKQPYFITQYSDLFRGLCEFYTHGKKRIKEIFQELQHQRWLGGGWLTALGDDSVTVFLFAEQNWHHETCQHTHLF